VALSGWNQYKRIRPVGHPLNETLFDWTSDAFDCDVIGRFQSAFGDEHVSVIDYDGLVASKADLTNSILTSAGFPQLPVTCPSESHLNPSVDLDDGLLVYVFAEFVNRMNNCTLNQQVGAQHLGYLKTLSLPKHCYRMEITVDAAQKRDKECREQYGHLFVFEDETATSLGMHEKLPYCELDTAEMLRSREWAERLQQQYNELRPVPHLCTGEKGK